jgi:hypothetical protein
MSLRFLIAALALLALAGCPKGPDDMDGGIDGGPSGDACLDSPDELTRAPNGQLPCELLPPGFKR